MANPKTTEGRHEIPNGEGGILEYFVHGSNGPFFTIIPPAWGPTCLPYETGSSPLHPTFTTIYLTPRGSGGSSRPLDESRMTSQHVTDDIEILRAHLQIPQIPHMMGHSHGGTLCLYYAIRFPSRVAKSILLAPAVYGIDRAAGMEAVRKQRYDDQRFTVAFDALSSVLVKPETNEEFARHLQNMLPAYFWDPKRYMIEFASVLPAEPQVWNSQHIYSPHADNLTMVGKLGDISASIWAVFGDVDPVCVAAPGKVLRKEIDGGKGRYGEIIYEKRGHFPWIERKDLFWDDLRKFVAETRDSATSRKRRALNQFVHTSSE